MNHSSYKIFDRLCAIHGDRLKGWGAGRSSEKCFNLHYIHNVKEQEQMELPEIVFYGLFKMTTFTHLGM